LAAPEPPATFLTLAVPAGVLAVRDVEEQDIAEFVRYWHSGSDHLDYLRIDRRKLGTAEETAARFRAAMRTGDLAQPAVAFTLAVNDEPCGYFNVNRYSPTENYPHIHLTTATQRSKGVATAAVPCALKLLFELYPIERLTLETRTSVTAINRVLDSVAPVSKTLYLKDPDGLAGPGEFHHRYVHRGDVILPNAKADSR
jgi:RimJ/RimL family protein N-acetyltransferase